MRIMPWPPQPREPLPGGRQDGSEGESSRIQRGDLHRKACPHTVHHSDVSVLQEYFNTEGFNRWNRIYSDSDDVNKVQADIR